MLSNSLISNVIISDIPCEPRQQPLCETECGDNDEVNELGDHDRAGFFVKLPFLVQHTYFRKEGEGGGHTQWLKKFYRPRVVVKILTPLVVLGF